MGSKIYNRHWSSSRNGWSVLVLLLVVNVLFICLWVFSHFFRAFDRLCGCSCCFSRYIPPLLWGKSGHLQTALYGKLGRVSSPHPSGVRKYLPMQDGATSTFDLFEPIGDHQTGGDHCTTQAFFVLTLSLKFAQNLNISMKNGPQKKNFHMAKRF